jgi:hypothetical protein
MLVAALVILAGVVVVASGRGGEMAYEHPDYPPLDLGPVSAADVALLRPPSAAWGYNMRVTDEALNVIARGMSERDVRISSLEQQVDDLRAELSRGGTPWPGARHAARDRDQDRDRDRPQDTFAELPMPAWPPTRAEPTEPANRQEQAPQRTGFEEPGFQAAGSQEPESREAEPGEAEPGEAESRQTALADTGFPDSASQPPASEQPASGHPFSGQAGPADTVADQSIPAVTADGLPQQAPDDTVADQSIPAVTADGLPRQAQAGDQAGQDGAPQDAMIHHAAGRPRHDEETGE